MSIIHNISARRKILVLVLLMVLFGLASGLTFLHTMNSVSQYRELERRFDSFFNELHTIEHHILSLGLAWADSTEDITSILENLGSDSDNFSSRLLEFSRDPLIANDSIFIELINGIQGNIYSLKNRIESLVVKQLRINPVTEYNNLHKEHIDPLLHARILIMNRIYENSFNKQRRYSANLILLMFLIVLIIALIVIFITLNNSRNTNRLLNFTKELGKGGRPARLLFPVGHEYGDIANHLNSYLEKQDEKISFLKTIGDEPGPVSFDPGKDDILGNEIRIMAERLKRVQSDEKKRQSEDKRASWTSEGIAQFADILRSERENVKELSFRVIQNLVTYLNVEMGTIFLMTGNGGEQKKLKTIAAYAYDRRKYIDKSFELGEGLPGTCALEKEKIYINEVPEEYSDIISGVGMSKPRFVLLVPLKIQEEIFGIIELASFRGLEEHELRFVDQLAESIASTLQSVKTNEQTAVLLHQSQEQSEELLHNEQQLRNNLENLERAREESHRRESEITGILNAMNEASLVAEFNLNGRFTHINDKFTELMESPRETILGKHHHEFAVVDKYAADYRNFWEELRSGRIITREEQLKMFSGKEVWLQQIFTPILNQEGNVYKILNIAVDITRSKQQQASLEKQSAEIIRQNLEMESLNEAVNSAIIKCDLDHEGIILDANRNFELTSGLNRKEILGRNYRLFLKDMEKEQFEKIWQEVLKGKTYEGATRRTKPTGEELWLMSTFSPVKDESGSIYKIYFLALDITEKKLKYQLLEEANREIERLRQGST
jgi:PAS domain S-box-containing protein